MTTDGRAGAGRVGAGAGAGAGAAGRGGADDFAAVFGVFGSAILAGGVCSLIGCKPIPFAASGVFVFAAAAGVDLIAPEPPDVSEPAEGVRLNGAGGGGLFGAGRFGTDDLGVVEPPAIGVAGLGGVVAAPTAPVPLTPAPAPVVAVPFLGETVGCLYSGRLISPYQTKSINQNKFTALFLLSDDVTAGEKMMMNANCLVCFFALCSPLLKMVRWQPFAFCLSLQASDLRCRVDCI